MRIYAAADLHGKTSLINTIRDGIRRSRAEAAVLAGDILNYRLKKDILGLIDDLPVPVLYVRGNSDPASLDQWATTSANVHSLHLNPTSINGVDFVGSSGTLPLPFNSRVGWRESDVLRQLTPLVHSQSIVVAHPPPRGCRDKVLGRFHAGSCGLSQLIAETKPPILICGHIHEAAGIGSIGETRVVNCALGTNYYGAIIEVKDGFAPSAVMLRGS